MDGVVWNFNENFDHSDNVFVTNNIIDFIGAQITGQTGMAWNRSIGHNELRSKIILVFRRQRGKNNMTAEKKASLKKQNTRKTRRVTVSNLKYKNKFFDLR